MRVTTDLFVSQRGEVSQNVAFIYRRYFYDDVSLFIHFVFKRTFFQVKNTFFLSHSIFHPNFFVFSLSSLTNGTTMEKQNFDSVKMRHSSHLERSGFRFNEKLLQRNHINRSITTSKVQSFLSAIVGLSILCEKMLSFYIYMYVYLSKYFS